MGNDSGFFLLVVAIVLLCNGILGAVIGILFVAAIAIFIWSLLCGLTASSTKSKYSGKNEQQQQKNDNSSHSAGVVTQVGKI